MALSFCFKFLSLLKDSTNYSLVIIQTFLLSFHFITEILSIDFGIVSLFSSFFFIVSTGIYFLSDLKVPVM